MNFINRLFISKFFPDALLIYYLAWKRGIIQFINQHHLFNTIGNLDEALLQIYCVRYELKGFQTNDSKATKFWKYDSDRKIKSSKESLLVEQVLSFDKRFCLEAGKRFRILRSPLLLAGKRGRWAESMLIQRSQDIPATTRRFCFFPPFSNERLGDDSVITTFFDHQHFVRHQTNNNNTKQ